jgi:hypothetical protein
MEVLVDREKSLPCVDEFDALSGNHRQGHGYPILYRKGRPGLHDQDLRNTVLKKIGTLPYLLENNK